MKKLVLLTSCLAFLATGVFITGCKKDKKEDPVVMTITNATATETSISATITPSSNAVEYYYAIMAHPLTRIEPTDIRTMTGVVKVTGNNSVTATFDDLYDETTYAIFAQGVDKNGRLGKVAGLDITTNDATIPRVSLRYDDLTTMTVDVTFTPNSLVSEYLSLMASKEVYYEFLDMFADGNEVEFMEIMAMFGMASTHTATTSEKWFLNGETDYEYYIVVLAYDLNGNPYEPVTKSLFTSPQFINGLPIANATIQTSDITPTSVKVRVTPDDNTFGYYAGRMTKSDYEEDMHDEDYLRQVLAFFSDPLFGEDFDTWTLDASNTEWVIIASPFNANGIHGYGPLAIHQFSTAKGRSAVSSQVPSAFKPSTGKKALTKEMLEQMKRK
ncbi:MAG: hypothetical protein FWE63_04450 [Bacteroidales bacterium]|nr:hypothetical protein [Bacteroidales bacterium]